MALVRDPMFWRRFSRAIHLDEEAKALSPHPESKPVAGSGETTSSISSSTAEMAGHEKVPSMKKSAVYSYVDFPPFPDFCFFSGVYSTVLLEFEMKC